MNKLFVLTLKVGISLLPKALRESLKNNLGLMAFYTQNLRSAGFIHALPSDKIQKASYKKISDNNQKKFLSYRPLHN